jgi:hypothetical protein
MSNPVKQKLRDGHCVFGQMILEFGVLYFRCCPDAGHQRGRVRDLRYGTRAMRHVARAGRGRAEQ